MVELFCHERITPKANSSAYLCVCVRARVCVQTQGAECVQVAAVLYEPKINQHRETITGNSQLCS